MVHVMRCGLLNHISNTMVALCSSRRFARMLIELHVMRLGNKPCTSVLSYN